MTQKENQKVLAKSYIELAETLGDVIHPETLRPGRTRVRPFRRGTAMQVDRLRDELAEKPTLEAARELAQIFQTIRVRRRRGMAYHLPSGMEEKVAALEVQIAEAEKGAE